MPKSPIKTYYLKALEYVLYCFVCALYLGSAPLSITLVALYILTIPRIFCCINRKKIFHSKGLLLMLVYFIIMVIVTLINSSSLSDLLELDPLLPLLIFPLVIASDRGFKLDTKAVAKVLNIYVFAGIISFALSLLFGIYRSFFEEVNINFVYITYKQLSYLFGVHPIYLSVLYFTSIFLLIEGFCTNTHLMKFKWLYLSVFLLGIVLLSSRTALLVTFLYGIQLIIKKRKSINRISYVTIIGSIFILITISFSIPSLKNRITKFDQNISSYSGLVFRMKVWESALNTAVKSPLIGFGFKASQIELKKTYRSNNFRRAFLQNLNAHNQYIQSLLDGGIICLISLILLVFYPIFASPRHKASSIYFILFAVFVVSESFLVRQLGVAFFSFIYLILLNSNKKISSYSNF